MFNKGQERWKNGRPEIRARPLQRPPVMGFLFAEFAVLTSGAWRETAVEQGKQVWMMDVLSAKMSEQITEGG